MVSTRMPWLARIVGVSWRNGCPPLVPLLSFTPPVRELLVLAGGVFHVDLSKASECACPLLATTNSIA